MRTPSSLSKRHVSTPVSNPMPGQWGRGRLLAVLVTAIAVGAALVAGLGYAIYLAFAGVSTDQAHPSKAVADGPTSSEKGTVQGTARRDEIAADPMIQVPAGAEQPAEASSGQERRITIPIDTGITGPALVATGFPATPQGAIGQLAQIDVAVLTAMNARTAREVYAAWALPGGVAVDEWWTATAVDSFLSGSGMNQGIASDAAVQVEPVAALVKGTDGPDWSTVCVLLKLTATYRSEAAVAWAHCERMQWVGGRWMIAPGPPPAAPPATWPGTALAKKAGWRTWTSTTTTNPGGEHHG